MKDLDFFLSVIVLHASLFRLENISVLLTNGNIGGPACVYVFFVMLFATVVAS